LKLLGSVNFDRSTRIPDLFGSSLFDRRCRGEWMEHLWSPAGATGGKWDALENRCATRRRTARFNGRRQSATRRKHGTRAHFVVSMGEIVTSSLERGGRSSGQANLTLLEH
jgi:hypothetical protein